MSDEETRRGARNRAQNAKSATPNADYWIGIEGGCESIDNELTAFAWIVIINRAGRFSESRSATFALPPAIAELVYAGVELGEADDRIFGRQNSKQMNGAVGILTRDVVDRIALYDLPVALALIPFRNPALYA
jgi:inosine/xanthosine triphosphatase